MPKSPRISGQDAIKAFKKLGWEVSRQRGSHTKILFTEVTFLSPPKSPNSGGLKEVFRVGGKVTFINRI